MQVKVVNLPYRRELAGFEDAALARFLDGKDVVRVSEYFFSVDDQPHLACLVQWQPSSSSASSAVAVERAPAAAARATTRTRRARANPVALDGAGAKLEAALRSWRAGRARELGVPAYRVLTNRQLDALVEKRPQVTEELRAIEGFGPATVTTHGEHLLALMRGAALD